MRPELYQWLGNPALAPALQEILGDTLLKRAIEIAQAEIERPLDLQEGNILERNALAYAESQGARKLVAKLQELANPPKQLLDQTVELKPLPEAYRYLSTKEEKHSVV